MKIDLRNTTNENSRKLCKYIHPSYDLSHVKNDLNYFVYSRDEYLLYLVTLELVDRLSDGVKLHELSPIECDGIKFFHKNNVVMVDVKSILRKFRPDIEGFIARIVKRQPLFGDKHIVCIQNFEEISTRFQINFKSLIEKNSQNACFIFTSTRHQQEIFDAIVPFCSLLRTPGLNKKQSKALCTQILACHDDDLKLDFKINHELPIYNQVIAMNSMISNGRSYTNVFKNEISDLVNFLKRKRMLDKVIVQIRASLNKILYYTISDEEICGYIMAKLLSLKNFDKHKAIEKLAQAQLRLCTASKKIFVYELLFIQVYLILHS